MDARYSLIINDFFNVYSLGLYYAIHKRCKMRAKSFFKFSGILLIFVVFMAYFCLKGKSMSDCFFERALKYAIELWKGFLFGETVETFPIISSLRTCYGLKWN